MHENIMLLALGAIITSFLLGRITARFENLNEKDTTGVQPDDVQN
jgi:hypothetical protein